jgi:hypothetical protein
MGSLVLVGCSDDDDEKTTTTTPTLGPNAAAVNLTNQAFVFGSGEVFGIDPGLGPVTLVFGSFSGTKGAFRLEAGGGNSSATGEATVGSCILQVNIGNFAATQGPQAGGAPLTFDSCTVENSGAALRLENRTLGKTATSIAQGVATNPPGGIGRLTTPSRSTSIALTSADRHAIVANR